MKMRFSGLLGPACLGVLVSLFACLPFSHGQYLDETEHREGLHEYSPTQVALVGGRVHLSPTRIIEDAVLLIKDGKIQNVGAKGTVNIPDGYPTQDVSGKEIYPGFIDAYRDVNIESDQFQADYWNQKVRPELDITDFLGDEVHDDATRRSQGFVAVMAAPKGTIVDGSGALVFTGGPSNKAQRILATDLGQHLILTASFSFRGGGYPNSPMGAYALARQLFYDAQWYREALQVSTANPSVERVEFNKSLAALMPVISGERSIFVETRNELFALRADRFAREFGVGLVIVGSGEEYRRLNEVVALRRPIICPLSFPEAPSVEKLSDAMSVSLEDLMAWDHAPENPGRLASAGVQMAFTTRGLSSPNEFLKQLRVAVKRGLDPNDALEALTIGAAELLEVDDQLGTLEAGKLASFVVTSGDLFQKDTSIQETWIAGVRYEIKKDAPLDLSGNWSLQVEATEDHPAMEQVVTVSQKGDRITMSLPKEESEDEEDADEEDADEEDADEEDADEEDADESSRKEENKPALTFDKLSLDGLVLSGTVKGPGLDRDGVGQWSAVLDSEDPSELLGRLAWPDGGTSPLMLSRVPDEESDDDDADDQDADDDDADDDDADDDDADDDDADDEEADDEDDADDDDADADDDDDDADDKADSGKAADDGFATYPVNYPLGAYGRTEVPESASNVLFKNFTVWTSGPQGIIEGGSVLINDGVIVEIYPSMDGVELPEGTTVIEGEGRHLSPGIIDCHSHMATDSGVNESGQAITAEVRIGDFIDCNDMTIYRQLAGGTTSANILHGSANPIGGQNQVVKLRWGAGDEALKFAEAPAGIKFALGENVKRSNGRQSQTRYPASRMGVEQILRDAFYSANEYRLKHRQWQTRKNGLPPRVDLELKALAEIVEGQRWIHCHSYRQDEILALIRTLDDFGVQIGTFQHILEGYKVADAMEQHGAMASAFADWWAYKIEVADAIPYAGSIMHDQGVIVSFNSDDGELGRRLNHEAAKAVKYGKVDPAEALKFVTLNPARQLRVDQYVGSIEKGKHADVVVWTGSPLSTMSRVDQTWIDGAKYFDRQEEAEQRMLVQQMRQTLIQKILDSGEGRAESGGRRGRRGGQDLRDDSDLWPRFDEFCKAKGRH